MKKILIFGSGGLVGSAVKRTFESDDNYKVFTPLRNEVDLFSFDETYNFINKINILISLFICNIW